MKSKSFNLKQTSTEKARHNKIFDFVSLYKTSVETDNKFVEKRKSSEIFNHDGAIAKSETPKAERSPNKNKKRIKQDAVNISQISIDGSSLNASSGGSTPPLNSKMTSNPRTSAKARGNSGKVKSIMKNTWINSDHTMGDSKSDLSVSKPKKRNKSVSFMLDDNEEVVIKKTKSNESIEIRKTNDSAIVKAKLKDKKKNVKKVIKDRHAEKENKVSDINNLVMDVENNSVKERSDKRLKVKFIKPKNIAEISLLKTESAGDGTGNVSQDTKKKVKKHQKSEESSEIKDTHNYNNDQAESKIKKNKKKIRKAKRPIQMETGEPAIKTRKKELKPDVIAEDLENLSIGDNAHTLTGLLDEMTVADKEKHKKNKRKLKTKKQKPIMENRETADSENGDDEKEKIKWKKRKWNKDKKGDVNEDSLVTSVIVENLPLSLMLSYKKLLAEHFGKCGLIKKIGVAEVYPTEESKPVFTTTINFYSDGAATKALEEDKVSLEGSRIRVKRPLPPTETTVVVHSYAELTEQIISTAFQDAGKIRNIRQLIKGKKSMATAFIEFDGPESVERAIRIAENIKVGGKKMHISKFQLRSRKRNREGTSKNNGDSEEDSEDSRD